VFLVPGLTSVFSWLPHPIREGRRQETTRDCSHGGCRWERMGACRTSQVRALPSRTKSRAMSPTVSPRVTREQLVSVRHLLCTRHQCFT
jgi:hypothetical protein